MPKILVIEDEPDLARLLQEVLSAEDSFDIKILSNSSKAMEVVSVFKPALILLDILLPGIDGRQLLKKLKSNPSTTKIPVILLTALTSAGDKVLGLDLGAEDYIAKPFDIMELLARIRAVLRRVSPEDPTRKGILKNSGLVLDVENKTGNLNRNPLNLRPKEFEILYLLASHPGRTLTRTFLLENSSSYGMEVATRSLDTHIKNIRHKLGASGARLIQTIPRIGYRFNRRSD